LLGAVNVNFPDGSRHSCPCYVLLVSYRFVTSVIVIGGGKNAAVNDLKPKCTNSAKSIMDANMQLTINNFRPLFPDKIFSPTPYSVYGEIHFTQQECEIK